MNYSEENPSFTAGRASQCTTIQQDRVDRNYSMQNVHMHLFKFNKDQKVLVIQLNLLHTNISYILWCSTKFLYIRIQKICKLTNNKTEQETSYGHNTDTDITYYL